MILTALIQPSTSPDTFVGLVAQNVVEVRFYDGYHLRGKLRPLASEERVQPGFPHSFVIDAEGRNVGMFNGTTREVLPYDRMRPSRNGTDLDAIDGWSVTFEGSSLAVLDVHRKTRPTDYARVGPWEFEKPLEHTVYLVLDEAIDQRGELRLQGPFGGAQQNFDPDTSVTSAVHTSHIGYRPNDPSKLGFVSTWMGDGGALEYDRPPAFEVRSGSTVAFSGMTTLRTTPETLEDNRGRSFAKTFVYEADFSALEEPGEYTLCVEAIGCGLPFTVAREAYAPAFESIMTGFLWQRASYEMPGRPRSFHPDDGVKVFASTTPIQESRNGLNARGDDPTNFANLIAGATTEIVPNTWGGYFDAGDWDRRIQHLEPTRLLIELVELVPSAAERSWPMPSRLTTLPDLLEEAHWNLDLYRRMQTSEGGIRGGVESEEHPSWGETSWTNTLRNYAYAPDAWSSYLYAGVAARMANVLPDSHADLAQTYRTSALAAMQFAEEEWPTLDYDPMPHQIVDARNLAAVELYRLTGEERWHRIFRETTAFADGPKPTFAWRVREQQDAAFVYATLDRTTDPELRANCRGSVILDAEEAVLRGKTTAFGWTREDPNGWVGFGHQTGPSTTALIRAHHMTGDGRYLKAIVDAASYALGANPQNMTYTTGLGHDYPKNPLIADQRVIGEPAPPGITVYGPLDPAIDPDNQWWALMSDALHPPATEWPANEAYFDVFWYPVMTEYTMMETMHRSAFTFGYLATRP